MTATFMEHFSDLKDPRDDKNKKHQLMDILFLVIAAVISGAEGWEAIEAFGEEKLEWLRKYFPFANGVPSHDCIRMVMISLSPKALQGCFARWMQAVVEVAKGEVVAIDGKTIRRSFDQAEGLGAIHMVSAWAKRNGVSLGQVKTDEKSNEITAIPALLKLLELRGCIVTIDAMGCQRAIAEQIRAQGADYVLAVKANQKELHEALEDYFETGATGRLSRCPAGAVGGDRQRSWAGRGATLSVGARPLYPAQTGAVEGPPRDRAGGMRTSRGRPNL
jgi:hypothetical protein